MPDQRIVLTGIKPTGSPHIGNLLGAIRPALKLAEDPSNLACYFIADYHALTSVRDPALLTQLTYEVAATWLAFGLDPERSLLYRQSDLPEVFELSWVLACFAPKGFMNKSHAYKAVVQENRDNNRDLDADVNMGLYTYPILMAADILLFDAEKVPVGKDQIQHVEIARDIAGRLNHTARSEVLRLPAAQVQSNVAVVPGLDGRKMSKSYNNTIPLFGTAKKLRKTVMRITTDSTPPDAPKDPKDSLIFDLYKALAPADKSAALAERYAQGISWGEAKIVLFEELDELLREPRARYDELMADTAAIDAILRAGAERAQPRARATLQRVRDAIGSTARPLG